MAAESAEISPKPSRQALGAFPPLLGKAGESEIEFNKEVG